VRGLCDNLGSHVGDGAVCARDDLLVLCKVQTWCVRQQQQRCIVNSTKQLVCARVDCLVLRSVHSSSNLRTALQNFAVQALIFIEATSQQQLCMCA
jgi:hypothetical protein